MKTCLGSSSISELPIPADLLYARLEEDRNRMYFPNTDAAI